VAAVSFALGLIGLLRMLAPASGGADEVRAVIRLPEPVTVTITGLFGLATAVMLIHLMRRGWRRRRAEEELDELPDARTLSPWMRTVVRIAPILYLGALMYGMWRGWIHIPDLGALARGAGAALGASVPRPTSPSAPAFFTWAFGLLGLAVGLAVLTLALWVALAERFRPWRTQREEEAPEVPTARAEDESLDALRADPDARRAIAGCYRNFQRAAADSRVTRRPWHTPFEFMREALRLLPLPRPALGTLTGLFERARFSHHRLGPGDRDAAIAALVEIKTALEEHRPHAG
jgi:hypothetical protein